MKNIKNNTTQKETHKQVVGLLRELVESDWWKLISSELESVMWKIKEKLWIPCSDESMRFNSRNLLNERLAALFIFKNLPSIMLNDIENMLATEWENAKTLQQKLEEQNKKLSEQLKQYIKS